MKNKLILLVLFLAGLELNAQVFVGGGLGIYSSSISTTTGSITNNGPSTLDYNFSPEVGFFIQDNLALGLRLSIFNQTTKTNVNQNRDDTHVTNSWSIAPFIRYYLAKSGNFSFFGEGALGIGGATSKNTSGSTTEEGPTTTIVSIGVSPGISYDLSEKVSLIAKLGGISYTSNSQKETFGTGQSATTTTTSNPVIGFNLGLNNLSFGAIVKF